MPGALRRSSLLALAAALALAGMSVTARWAPAKFAITKCGRVSDVDGSKAPVSAHKLSCARAKKVARYFLQNDDAPPGWKHGNPAGCDRISRVTVRSSVTGASSSSAFAAAKTKSTPGGNAMIVMFTAHQLKPGAWEELPPRMGARRRHAPRSTRAHHARNIRDEDEVISFGLFDMTEEDYRRWRGEQDAAETQRVDRLSAFVQNGSCAACTR